MRRTIISISLALLLSTAIPAEEVEGLIKLQDPLDEPELYCLDVPGFRDRVQLEAPLMAHTCKRRDAADELFTLDHPAEGQLYMKAYDLCVEAGGTQSGSELFLKPCSDSPLQRFELDASAKFRLTGEELCVAVAEGSGVPTGGPSHLRRDLKLEVCIGLSPSLSQWAWPIRE